MSTDSTGKRAIRARPGHAPSPVRSARTSLRTASLIIFKLGRAPRAVGSYLPVLNSGLLVDCQLLARPHQRELLLDVDRPPPHSASNTRRAMARRCRRWGHACRREPRLPRPRPLLHRQASAVAPPKPVGADRARAREGRLKIAAKRALKKYSDSS